MHHSPNRVWTQINKTGHVQLLGLLDLVAKEGVLGLILQSNLCPTFEICALPPSFALS
jgi:hypothetical protein